MYFCYSLSHIPITIRDLLQSCFFLAVWILFYFTLAKVAQTDSLKMNRHKHRKHPVPVPKPAREAPKCQYCGNTFTRKYYRDLHEHNNCKKRKMQMGELSPLTREEAMQWHSSTNMTKKDFNIIMDLICEKFYLSIY